MTETPIPVTLLTGFLGSGKSTLLTRILRDPRFSDTAVVVNEFGEVGLDGFLVEHSVEQTVEMTSGCLCCTIRGDVRETLMSLHRRRQEGRIPAFERLIIETTGLADPAPVIHTLISEPRLARRYMLGGIVTTVDITTAEMTLENFEEGVKQIAVADRIVLTKTDMAKDPASRSDLAALQDWIARLNPGAPVLDRHAPGFDLRRLFDTSLYDPRTKSMDVQKWLNEEAYAAGEGAPGAAHDHEHHHHDHGHHHHGHDHHHDHGHHHHGHDHHHDHDHQHDINRHGADIEAFSLVLDEPISSAAFTLGLDLLLSRKGADILRVKGILNIRERPGTPVVIHGVQHIFHDAVQLDAWPGDDRRSRIVFITRGLSRDTVATFFDALQSLTPGTDRAEAGQAEAGQAEAGRAGTE
ncbi:GTP-binding protein [Nisaea acidiphila]|uniref:GTP-binding protein n=1 Tax=Nisaea acidiphila TaxID=1862145 RepID=A0A9J7AMX2_9PROT|nr:GTP-binding protein [Nisaea acidiphila]UUX48800.1 GTP-binding protein [Nisaea acidiphila]